MIDWKAWLKSKAFWLGAVTALAGIREFIIAEPVEGVIAIVLAILIIIIRAFTNSAIAGTPGAKFPGVQIKK